MAGASDEERHSCSNSNSNSFKTISTAFRWAIPDDDSEDSGSPFVFKIEPTLLIDPHSLKIGEVIGEGSFSIVYQGLYNNELVAVKIIQTCRTSAISSEKKERFEREVTLLSRMKHENVIQFIGATIEPTLMIITELMRGGTLHRYLRSIRPETLDLKLSFSFALDISRVMTSLHANGIIHRDLKPSNLLLTEDKQRLKLSDFGLAREAISGKMTTEAGTYRWMAPELFSIDPLAVGEKKCYDHKVDVYSFSIILWELITNKTPFKGRNNVMVAYAAAKSIRPDLEEIPEEIRNLLKLCWAEDPNIRPEFAEITDSVSNLLRNLSTGECSQPNTVETVEVAEGAANISSSNTVETEEVAEGAADISSSSQSNKSSRKNVSFYLKCCRNSCLSD